MKTIDFKELSSQEKYYYLQNTITPRPIAFASTLSAEGKVNLSPFSFFNLMGSNPPILVFSPVLRGRDGSSKHTLQNIQEIPEVVIHMVHFDMVEQMSLSSCEYSKEVNEFEKAGFTQIRSTAVKPPRIAEALVAFECKVLEVKSLGNNGGAGNLVICEVQLMHIAEELFDENEKIDPTKTDFVARSGGDWYVRSTPQSMFTVPKPSTQLGVGFEAIPKSILEAHIFSPNQLGRLANIEELPSAEAVQSYFETHQNQDFFAQVVTHLEKQEIKQAWLALMNLKATKY